MENRQLLEIKNLEVIYETDEETVMAVNKVNLKLDRKETLGLVGETGAGKTTTALSILRLLPNKIGKVTNGQIIFDGCNLLEMEEEDMREIRGARISMIFQDPMSSLNPVITVGKQIEEVVRLHNTDNKSNAEIQERVDEMLELVGIPSKRKNEYPYQFSGGMKQRVVIAIALACNPELIIADEPTTALDVTIQAQVLSMMAELKEKLNTSMLLITHDLGIVAETCDRVAIMYAGEIIESGTVEDVYEAREHHPYTIGLFNSIPDLDEDKDRLSPIDGLMPDPTNLPDGCKFHTRCPQCMEICKKRKPDDYIQGTHMINCHLFNHRDEE